MYTRIECAQDKRSWAEVQEEEKGEVVSVPYGNGEKEKRYDSTPSVPAGKESSPKRENKNIGPLTCTRTRPSVPADEDRNRYDVCEVF